MRLKRKKENGNGSKRHLPGFARIVQETLSCTEKGNVGSAVWPEACVMLPQAVPEVMDTIIYFNWIS